MKKIKLEVEINLTMDTCWINEVGTTVKSCEYDIKSIHDVSECVQDYIKNSIIEGDN